VAEDATGPLVFWQGSYFTVKSLYMPSMKCGFPVLGSGTKQMVTYSPATRSRTAHTVWSAFMGAVPATPVNGGPAGAEAAGDGCGVAPGVAGASDASSIWKSASGVIPGARRFTAISCGSGPLLWTSQTYWPAGIVPG